jgi:hypothetical protein
MEILVSYRQKSQKMNLPDPIGELEKQVLRRRGDLNNTLEM